MTHFLRAILVFGIFGACIVSCSKPHDKVIPLDKKKWDAELRPTIERLSDEDRQYLKRYLARLAPGSDAGKNNVPPGTTIADAISEQRSLEVYKEQRRQSAKKAEVEAQRRAPIVLKLVEKKPYEIYYVELTFVVANQGEEEIRALKGIVRVTDTVNDTIASAEMTIAGPIAPKNSIQTKARFGSYLTLPDRRWDNDISLAIDLSKVTFSDGSELSVPKED